MNHLTYGIIALFVWAAGITAVVLTSSIPPFQLSAMVFFIGYVLLNIWAGYKGTLKEAYTINIKTFSFLFCGIGLYGFY